MTSINNNLLLSLLVIYGTLLITCQSICTTGDSNCFSGCKDQHCDYNPSNNYFYNNSVDNSTGYHGSNCCDGCIDGYFLLEDDKSCKTTCLLNNDGDKTYGDEINNKCEDQCPSGYFGDNDTRLCVASCPTNSFAHQDINVCVTDCFGSYPFQDTTSKVCLATCPTNMYGSIALNKCRETCPPTRFGDNVTGLCEGSCPDGSYAHPTNRICVAECFGNYELKNQDENSCDQTYFQETASQSIDPMLIGIAAAGVVMAGTLTLLSYKYYCKKRLIRKPWKYDMVKDIQFSV